jgi:hypothetical protein
MPNVERQKLTAAWLNIVAAGTVSTGAVVQLAAVSSGERAGPAAVQSMATAFAFLLAGVLLHLLARQLIGPGSAEGEAGAQPSRERQD